MGKNLTLMIVFYLALVSIVVLAAIVAYRRYRKNRFISQPLSSTELEIINANLPVFNFLNPKQVSKFHHVYRDFLYTKNFVGCAGQEITDEIKIVVASGAAFLVVNRPKAARIAYKTLRWIYIYPAAFIANRKMTNEDGSVSTENMTMLGESWELGRVVLSWSDVKGGLQDFDDGHNVLLHEFAHQLDSESGDTNGAPLLNNRHAYNSWSKILSKEFLTLQRRSTKGKKSVMDSYGATNPAEFFAVATETFFEKPYQLKRKHPELYTELSNYYGFDPALWVETSKTVND